MLASLGRRVGTVAWLTSFIDKREYQAALPQGVLESFADPFDADSEMWFDYTSDAGDGFEALSTMANLLVAPELKVEHESGVDTLERGELLVLGGDQVYPYPTRTGYRDRLFGPLAAAWPSDAGHREPVAKLFSIPGNHDWYDGLTDYIRQLARPIRVGGWITEQRRSYFAVRLPHNWWLWGIDISLDSYVDEPQMAYFRDLAKQLTADDQVILCTPTPSWVEGERQTQNLRFFERETLGDSPARVELMVSGDLHHFAHYEKRDEDRSAGSDVLEEPRHLITAGACGSFLHPTHPLPTTLAYGASDEHPPAAYDQVSIYPMESESRRLSWRGGSTPIRILARNAGVGVITGGITLAVACLVALLAWLRDVPLAEMGVDRLGGIVGVVALCALPIPLVGVTRMARTSGYSREGIGLLAMGLVTIGLILLSLRVGTAFLVQRAGLFGFLAGSTVMGAVLISAAAALYVTVTCRFLAMHGNETFAGLRYQSHRSFLRMHIDRVGTLRVYPVGIENVTTHWRFRPEPGLAESVYSPLDDPGERLIRLSAPITVLKRPRR